MQDTGTGIPEEILDRVFEPFFTTKGEGEGTGLGLSTVFGIVEQSRGHIVASNPEAGGAAFRVAFPVVDRPATEEGLDAALRARVEGTETILLAEDDAGIRSLLADSLRRSGYVALEAADGTEALAVGAAHEGPIHLLVSDVVMPGSGGPEVFEGLSPHRPRMKVLYLTGYPGDHLQVDGTLASGGPLLRKPFKPTDLLDRVRVLLDEGDPGAGVGLAGPT